MTYLSLLLISIYIIYYIIKFKKIPNSLSATYYDMGWIFSLVILISIILIINNMFEITPENFKFLPFISIAGIIFVAFAPNFNADKLID